MTKKKARLKRPDTSPRVRRVRTDCSAFLRTSSAVRNGLSSVDLPLLRLVCLGNPEMVVQGELLAFLRDRGHNAVSEFGVIGSRRRLDIVVFDKSWNTAICAVELKHFSANQDSNAVSALRKLASALKSDYERHKVNSVIRTIPLIQIGLFTEVEKVELNSQSVKRKDIQFGWHRFLHLYYKKPLVDYNVRPLKNNAYASTLVSPKMSRTKVGRFTATGRVHYLIRVVAGARRLKGT